jgi:hypothetical protein
MNISVLDTRGVISIAEDFLQTLSGHIFDVLEVRKPVSPDAAVNLSKIVSKLSPFLGNTFEFNTCELLNDRTEFKGLGTWRRQDPGFPDLVFDGPVSPTPGIEIKAWFPLATEITGRFKDSETHFHDDRTYVAMIAWLPEFLIYGKPKILGVVTASGQSVAKARDSHYHNPPDYIVLEPEDTKERTKNLQQTNTYGYKWQAEKRDPAREARNWKAATEIVESWGPGGKTYSTDPEYQAKLRKLQGTFNYRNDTNYAKIDRIGHPGIEAFAEKVYAISLHGMTIGQWNSLLSSKRKPEAIKAALAKQFKIGDTSAELLK